MIVVTVARRPLDTGSTVAQNVLVNGCGGYAVDAVRVAHTSDDPQFRSSMGGSNTGPVYDLGINGPHIIGNPHPQSLRHHCVGRWPANLLLQHLPECENKGTTRVRPKEGHRPNPVSVQSDGHIHFTEKPAGYRKVSYTGADGLEEVESWKCAPGCPVKEIDEQSGVGHARGNTSPTKRGFTGVTSFMSGGVSAVDAGDAGGASRFFKQVKAKS